MTAEKSKFLFTHREEILDEIEGLIRANLKVIEVSQNSGFWYSNGETGPEWFSMEVICLRRDKETVQDFINENLKFLDADHIGKTFTDLQIYSTEI
jgi:hypothetical protein